IDKFGKHGLDGGSTRDIAAAPVTAVNSITYQSGRKEGLHQAAAEHSSGYLRQLVFEPPIPGPGENAPDDERRIWFAPCEAAPTSMLHDGSAAFAPFISREQPSPSPAVRELIRNHMEQTMSLLTQQVGLTRPVLDRIDVRATTLFLFGMAVTLRHSRTTLHPMIKLQSLDDELKARLVASLRQMARAELVKA
ncbi:MAG: CerR family C-terminal domain-containing protein, partial [Erythrobacter sp.]